jgi:hypothetical protein
MLSLFRKVNQSSSNSKVPVWWNRYWKKSKASFVGVLSGYEAKASKRQKKKALFSFISLMTLVFSFWLYQGISGSRSGRHIWMPPLHSHPVPAILEDKSPPTVLPKPLYHSKDKLPDSTHIK